ncbi:MAG TPA: TIGR02996 domain-containing protein, partial [Gemmataceae bacterium]
RAAFLRAIAENPDDDLPRLVYADWLDEHGEPERAEFIRVQCELARLPRDEARFAKLQRREEELLTKYETEWRPGSFDGLTFGPFERGFVRALAATQFEAFLAHIWDIKPLRPIHELRIGRMRTSQLRRLAQVRLLSAFTLLDVSNGTIGNDAIPAFVRSPHLHNLRLLNLAWHRIGDVGAQALAEATTLAGLQSLELQGNRIGDTGAEALAASPHLASLSRLDLRGNPIGREGRAILRARFGTAVKL